MTTTEMNQLRPGDIVKHCHSHNRYVVTGNYGGRVTAVCSVDITNPTEWEVLNTSPTIHSHSIDDVLSKWKSDRLQHLAGGKAETVCDSGETVCDSKSKKPSK